MVGRVADGSVAVLGHVSGRAGVQDNVIEVHYVRALATGYAVLERPSEALSCSIGEQGPTNSYVCATLQVMHLVTSAHQ